MVRNDEKKSHLPINDWAILGGIWLLGTICDRVWLARDRTVPEWDQTHHLTGSLNYLHALQQAQWFSGEWWRELWMLSSKNPPLTYIITAPFQQLFGRNPDSALLVTLFFSAILLGSVYGLGKLLFNRQVGLIAAFLCVIFPSFYFFRLQYLLDYPLTAWVMTSFWCLTSWRGSKGKRQWLWALRFGVCLGLAILTKQSAFFFLVIPGIWLLLSRLWQRRWGQVAQALVALGVSACIFLPWYSTNWIYFLGNYQSGIAAAAVREGDPPLNSWAAWTYYLEKLPEFVPWFLFIIPIVSFLLFILKNKGRILYRSSLSWLALFLGGGYLFCSALVNKDTRYVLPLLPVLAILLAYGLTLLPKRWAMLRWGTLGLSLILMLLNLFPLGGSWTEMALQTLHLGRPYYPYRGAEFPHTEVVEEIIETAPQLQATVGVLPVTAKINHNNFNYYGALEDFQVYGREVGARERYVEGDARSLDWFLSKTRDRGTDRKAEEQLRLRIEQSPDFQLHQTWAFPDSSTLQLYHRKVPSVVVQPLAQSVPRVRLNRVIVPESAPPGVPVPVTYEWSGSGEALQSGIVLITWEEKGNPQNRWLHDRAIAQGRLQFNSPSNSFQVTERTAMFPQKTLPPGDYAVTVTYLNRETGETYPIATPSVQISLNPNVAVPPAPELDLVTQMRNLAADLPQGIDALERVFDEIGRINQYDPVQDYTQQAELSLAYRLEREPDNLEWAYGLAFSQILQEDVEGAIAALQNVARLDSQNPFAHAYLAFIYLYDWQPKAAQNAIQTALKLEPNRLEFQAIDGISALMQGNVAKTWRIWQEIKPKL
ncbi:glycosyltransferase family 39 protein [Lusitaniella coriacea]|uniref:glycosyltransferase family 39 protein n=1 Tax=Lusitaniella coriacea TaxID=1983105 RepID=UPI003CE727DC